MLIAVNIPITDLAKYGKNFQWPRPTCPKCEGKVWGHGFRFRYFSEFSDGLYLKRYRCSNCKVVISLTPIGYWPRFRSPIDLIYSTIHNRLKQLSWPPGVTRQRGGHWLRKFIVRFKMAVGLSTDETPLLFLEKEHRRSINFLVGESCKPFHEF